MKKVTLLGSILLSILMAACACGKKAKPLPIPDAPFLTMEVNGKPWSNMQVGANFTPTIPNDRFLVTAEQNITIAGQLRPKEGIRLAFMYKKMGRQYLQGAPSLTVMDSIVNHPNSLVGSYGNFNTHQQGGEFVCEEFWVINEEPEQSWVEVVQQQENYKRIWGKFELKMKRTIHFGCPEKKYTDTINIKNGTFYVELP